MNASGTKRAKLKHLTNLAEAYLVETVYDSEAEMDPLQEKIMSLRFHEPIEKDSEDGVDSAAIINNVNSLEPDDFNNVNNDQFYSSSSEEFLSGSECPLDDFSEFEKDKVTDPELLKAIPKLDLSEVEKTWGTDVKHQLENLMDEYESLFMKHKADLGRCKLAEHGIDLIPDAEPHREGAFSLPTRHGQAESLWFAKRVGR